MASRIVPMLDRVLVRKAAQELKSAGGILLPESSTKVNEGEVVAVGAGGRNKDGATIAPLLKVGDKVVLPDYAGQKLNVDNQELFIYREDDIVAILKQ